MAANQAEFDSLVNLIGQARQKFGPSFDFVKALKSIPLSPSEGPDIQSFDSKLQKVIHAIDSNEEEKVLGIKPLDGRSKREVNSTLKSISEQVNSGRVSWYSAIGKALNDSWRTIHDNPGKTTIILLVIVSFLFPWQRLITWGFGLLAGRSLTGKVVDFFKDQFSNKSHPTSADFSLPVVNKEELSKRPAIKLEIPYEPRTSSNAVIARESFDLNELSSLNKELALAMSRLGLPFNEHVFESFCVLVNLASQRRIEVEELFKFKKSV